ncbi:hypothetical protein J7J47_03740 [Halomonas sp. ISL-60]|uniref:hypothetical protein n=1 Tax=Halomonas sp. ISL-56 TaxID=2819149 RepID=UPI001BE6FD58|nr:hypothetical protein [Halomonas sp. ISL-56]MBT2771342.1 hypothetical protein [Halomonas sp. ISL-60]MBT2800699.1 hypothetical protein [Halomonas sp. ISL-56]
MTNKNAMLNDLLQHYKQHGTDSTIKLAVKNGIKNLLELEDIVEFINTEYIKQPNIEDVKLEIKNFKFLDTKAKVETTGFSSELSWLKQNLKSLLYTYTFDFEMLFEIETPAFSDLSLNIILAGKSTLDLGFERDFNLSSVTTFSYDDLIYSVKILKNDFYEMLKNVLDINLDNYTRYIDTQLTKMQIRFCILNHLKTSDEMKNSFDSALNECEFNIRVIEQF